jgi:hypothetical protein
MKDHLRRSFLYKNSQFEEENSDRNLRPNKNIILAILNVQYRTEGFDVKDIQLYIDNPDEYYKSFIVSKFHDRWALDNQIDTFIDEVVESYVDYGGTLVRKTDGFRPEVIDLRSLAFCDQTNILANPFCIKHSLSPSQLRDYDKWGDAKYGATIDKEALILLCKDEKRIDIYELHGTLPKEWLLDSEVAAQETKRDIQQIQIVAYYQDQNRQERGVTLFKHREPILPFKFLSRDKIYGRALGRGGVEELFEAQIWTNWTEVKVTEMLEAASKMIPVTNDPTLIGKHPTGLKNIDNLELIEVGEGRQLSILNTYPQNLTVFNNAMDRWEVHAQQLGSTGDVLLGEAPSSGTPFKLYEAQAMEAKSMHRYRQGQIAVFIDEIYREWILPDISKKLSNAQTLMVELSVDEMRSVADSLINSEVNKFIKKLILEGKIVDKDLVDIFKQDIRQQIIKSNTKFIELVENEINSPIRVKTNIVGKQKNLAMLTDKLVNVLRQFISVPQLRQDPEMVKLLNTILESSGLSPIMFGPSPIQPVGQFPLGGELQSTMQMQSLIPQP